MKKSVSAHSYKTRITEAEQASTVRLKTKTEVGKNATVEDDRQVAAWNFSMTESEKDAAARPQQQRQRSVVLNRAILRGLTNNKTMLGRGVAKVRENPGEGQRSARQNVVDLRRPATNEYVGAFFKRKSKVVEKVATKGYNDEKVPPTPSPTQSSTETIIQQRRQNEQERKAAEEAASAKLQAHFETITMSSMVQYGQLGKVLGMTTIPKVNHLAIVHDNFKISILAVGKNLHLALIATLTIFKKDRRDKEETVLLPMNGCITATSDEIFVVGKRGRKIYRLAFRLFESTINNGKGYVYFETQEIVANRLAKSNSYLGLAVCDKFDELYASTGSHIVVYSIETGTEMLRSAVVQPPGQIIGSWEDAGVCYGIPDRTDAAIRIKFFRKENHRYGYDVKLSRTEGMIGKAGAVMDPLSDSFLIISNSSVFGLAASQATSSSCCASLPCVKVIDDLREYGIVQPVGIAVLDPTKNKDENDIKKHKRSMIAVLDASSSAVFIFS